MISASEFVQASGSWINDRTHGVQFRASFLKATAPTTIEGIEKYLGSGMIRGIGPVYAKKLVRAFGEPCSACTPSTLASATLGSAPCRTSAFDQRPLRPARR
jgi:hypothetical protein